jgi:uncharacterized membrane protein HdeD (DUF308 family)
MTSERESKPFYARQSYRLISGGFGVCLAGLGIYAMLFAETSIAPRLIGGAVLVLVGVNMTLSAYRARESWLSRIGPLP